MKNDKDSSEQNSIVGMLTDGEGKGLYPLIDSQTHLGITDYVSINTRDGVVRISGYGDSKDIRNYFETLDNQTENLEIRPSGILQFTPHGLLVLLELVLSQIIKRSTFSPISTSFLQIRILPMLKELVNKIESNPR